MAEVPRASGAAAKGDRPMGRTNMYVGMRVKISGLNSRPELNGTVGTALSFERQRDRYVVKISSDECVALKSVNLSLAVGNDTTNELRTAEEEISCDVAGAEATSMKPELCGDHHLWMHATFYAQRGEQFEKWWVAQTVPARRRRLRCMSSDMEDTLLDFLAGDPSVPEGQLRVVFMAPPWSMQNASGEEMCLEMRIHPNPILAIVKYFADAVHLRNAALRADGKVPVEPPSAVLGGMRIEGLIELTQGLLEMYMDETGDEAVQVLACAGSSRLSESLTQHIDETIGALRGRCGVSDHEVALIHGIDSAESQTATRAALQAAGLLCATQPATRPATQPVTDGEKSDAVEQDLESIMRKRVQRSSRWMDPAPDKNVKSSRSPTFRLTVSCRRNATAAIAIIVKIMRRHTTSSLSLGRVKVRSGKAAMQSADAFIDQVKAVQVPDNELVDIARSFAAIGDVVGTLDNMVLPLAINTDLVRAAWMLVENARVARNEAVAKAISPVQMGLVWGFTCLPISPEIAEEPLKNVLKFVGPADQWTRPRYAQLSAAAAHVGLSTAYIMTGKLRQCEKALTAAITAAPDWEPHEDADWRCRRAMVREQMGFAFLSDGHVHEIFLDFERAVAGLTPDDSEFVSAAFSLARYCLSPTGLTGNVLRGERYLALGEAALQRSLWLFGSDSKFTDRKIPIMVNIEETRKKYTALGPSGSEIRRVNITSLLTKQDSLQFATKPSKGERSKQLCSKCGISESKAGSKFKKCGRCGTTAYCSAECQKQHWPNHKMICEYLGSAQARAPVASASAAASGSAEVLAAAVDEDVVGPAPSAAADELEALRVANRAML